MAGSMSSGSSARPVSLALIATMKTNANTPPKIVFIRYITAGPTAMRTAPRSLLSRAMMSPVRMPEKNRASSVVSLPNRSFLRSYSIRLLTPFTSSRIR